MTIKPCLLILSYTNVTVLNDYITKALALCEYIFLPQDIANSINLPIIPLDINNLNHTKSIILASVAKAKTLACSHIITVDVCKQSNVDDLSNLIQAIHEHNSDILVGVRAFTTGKIPIMKRAERRLSAFWLRVQTSVKLQDIHSNTRAYPLEFFDFAHIREQGYAYNSESLVRAAWGGFNIREIAIKTPVLPSLSPSFSDHLRMIALNTHLTLRALVPLPFRRYEGLNRERVSLRHPIQALQQLMNDPYNKATPWQLARTAGISMAILTVPAPIIQSIFLLLSIGWLKLNRLCAIAMIPLTWPPFLPGLAILVGYRLRHGHWLTEFNIQTLGYEVGERLWEWVIGSLALTPILGLLLGSLVGLAAWLVAKK